MSRRKPKLRTWARGAPLKNGESEDGIVTSGLHDILEEEGPGSQMSDLRCGSHEQSGGRGRSFLGHWFAALPPTRLRANPAAAA